MNKKWFTKDQSRMGEKVKSVVEALKTTIVFKGNDPATDDKLSLWVLLDTYETSHRSIY